MVLAEMLLLVLDTLAMAGQRFELGVEVPPRAVNGEDGHVLQQSGKKDVLRRGHLRRLAERTRRRGGQEGPAPETRIVDADRLERAHR